MPPKSTMLETQIDENLRRIFEEEAQEELPSRLRDLLDRLDDIEVPAGTAPAAKGDMPEGRS